MSLTDSPNSAITCGACAQVIAADSNFCTHCGALVKTEPRSMPTSNMAFAPTEAEVLNAKAAYFSKQYELALPILKRAAQHGKTDAQELVGNMYMNGGGVERNDSEAMSWFSLAAKQGNRNAQAALGLLYGDAGDYERAREYWSSAAEQGDANSMYMLAEAYEEGEGGSVDRQRALRLYEAAAEKGQPLAH